MLCHVLYDLALGYLSDHIFCHSPSMLPSQTQWPHYYSKKKIQNLASISGPLHMLFLLLRVLISRRPSPFCVAIKDDLRLGNKKINKEKRFIWCRILRPGSSRLDFCIRAGPQSAPTCGRRPRGASCVKE